LTVFPSSLSIFLFLSILLTFQYVSSHLSSTSLLQFFHTLFSSLFSFSFLAIFLSLISLYIASPFFFIYRLIIGDEFLKVGFVEDILVSFYLSIFQRKGWLLISPDKKSYMLQSIYKISLHSEDNTD
jgi:hypothetical protein